NQMNAGTYTPSELCEKISGWLAAEKAAARINGYYTWQSPVTSNDGLRTTCAWRRENASDVTCDFRLYLPAEAAAFLGLCIVEPSNSGQTVMFARIGKTNVNNLTQGDA